MLCGCSGKKQKKKKRGAAADNDHYIPTASGSPLLESERTNSEDVIASKSEATSQDGKSLENFSSKEKLVEESLREDSNVESQVSNSVNVKIDEDIWVRKEIKVEQCITSLEQTQQIAKDVSEATEESNKIGDTVSVVQVVITDEIDSSRQSSDSSREKVKFKLKHISRNYYYYYYKQHHFEFSNMVQSKYVYLPEKQRN